MLFYLEVCSLYNMQEVFSKEIHASVAMENRIRQLFSYVDVTGRNISDYMEILRAEGKLPCEDKRAGKEALDRLCELLQYDPEDIRKDNLSGSVPALTGNVYKENTGEKKDHGLHLYIEEAVRDNENVKSIAEKLKTNEITYIKHYKDILAKGFSADNRKAAAKSIVLADKTGRLMYEGAPVCQDFGNRHFYYTSCVMNCLYDCEYCYLKGMYPSGIPVIFINLDDIFRETETLLENFPVYLCVSYDTDLMALEDITGYVRRWCEFTKSHRNLTIEIRTKCARTDLWKDMDWCDRVIFAYTLSPEEIINRYEKGTPHLEQRIRAIAVGMESYSSAVNTEGKTYPFRLCFDPMIYVKDWQEMYHNMWESIRRSIDLDHIRDYSVGSFRISDSYLKNMRVRFSETALVQYPYDVVNGYYQYPEKIAEEMESCMERLVSESVPGAKVFRWK